MTDLSENTKLRFDPQQGKIGLDQEQSRSNEPPHLEDTEAQMRRALGLYGDMSRRQENDRGDSPQRQQADRLLSGGHRRRFVQDGDVPVTVVRRDSGADIAANRTTLSTPTSSRLQRTEAALSAETSARERAERALSESQALARDLQTKIGHAELTKNEAIEALRREREDMANVRSAAAEADQRLRDANERIAQLELSKQEAEDALADERKARKAAEKSARDAESAREAAEQLIQDLSRQQAEQQARQKESFAAERPAARTLLARPPVEKLRATPARRAAARPVAAVETELEPEPVKWWLTTKPTPKRR